MKIHSYTVKRFSMLMGLVLVLSGCASTGVHNKQVSDVKEASSRISFAPAIDVSYSEVASDIKQNVGVNVRWGGQVIDSVVIDESTTRLTVYSYPLDSEGRPFESKSVQQKSGRFVVELTDGFAKESSFNGRFLTFYGGVVGESLVTNGNRQKAIPVVNAEELVDWNEIDDSQRNVRNRRGNAFYGLGYSTGHFGYRSRFGSSYYGGSRFGYGRSYYGNGYSSFYYSRGRGRSFRGFRGRHH